MDTIRSVSSKVYWTIADIINLLLIFFLSMVKLNKPSTSINRDDV